jgi:hypothetical protein
MSSVCRPLLGKRWRTLAPVVRVRISVRQTPPDLSFPLLSKAILIPFKAKTTGRALFPDVVTLIHRQSTPIF